MTDPSDASERLKRPLVSIIVPTYNRPHSLMEALQSIRAQTYAPIEAVVINDGGNDVEALIGSLGSELTIRYLSHSENRGLAAARNTGISAAKGDYIAYLDDDDLYYPQHVETLVNFLESTRCHVAYTDALRAFQERDAGVFVNAGRMAQKASPQRALMHVLSVISRHGSPRLRALSRRSPGADSEAWRGPAKIGLDAFLRSNGQSIVIKRDLAYSADFDAQKILKNNFVPVLCFMHHKSCFETTGLFDEKLTSHEDWDLWIRFSRRYAFAHIKQTTCEFSWRIDGSTMTSRMSSDFSRTAALISNRYRNYAAEQAGSTGIAGYL